jgi:hypothetical protein
MTQSFFQHFNCRQLSPDLSVLSRDYDEICYATLRWKVLAAVAIFGMIFVSIGVPIGMFIWMRRVMSTKIRAVRSGDVKRVTAYRDFDRKFRFMAGEFRPEAYYAECVDLLRKLIMTGALGLIPPGTVFQGYCSVMFSLTFLMAHAKLWPYPSMAANLLKLFTDVQVFLVTLTGLILKIDRGTTQDSISHGFGWTGSLYGDLMWVLLVLTTIPTALALVYKSPIEKAQRFLHKTARVDLDDEASTFAKRRQALRQRVQESTASRDTKAATGAQTTGRDPYRSAELKSCQDSKATDFDHFETKAGLWDAPSSVARDGQSARASSSSFEGLEGGWGTVRIASRQIQSARASEVIYTPSARPTDGGAVVQQPPARPAAAMAPSQLPDSVRRPSSASSQSAITLRPLPFRSPGRNSSSIGRKTPPDLRELSSRAAAADAGGSIRGLQRQQQDASSNIGVLMPHTRNTTTVTEEAPPSPSEPPLQSRVQASPVRPRVAPPPLSSLQLRHKQHP